MRSTITFRNNKPSGITGGKLSELFEAYVRGRSDPQELDDRYNLPDDTAETLWSMWEGLREDSLSPESEEKLTEAFSVNMTLYGAADYAEVHPAEALGYFQESSSAPYQRNHPHLSRRSGLSDEDRVRIIEGLQKGKALDQIADTIDRSNNTVRGYAEDYLTAVGAPEEEIEEKGKNYSNLRDETIKLLDEAHEEGMDVEEALEHAGLQKKNIVTGYWAKEFDWGKEAVLEEHEKGKRVPEISHNTDVPRNYARQYLEEEGIEEHTRTSKNDERTVSETMFSPEERSLLNTYTKGELRKRAHGEYAETPFYQVDFTPYLEVDSEERKENPDPRPLMYWLMNRQNGIEDEDLMHFLNRGFRVFITREEIHETLEQEESERDEPWFERKRIWDPEEQQAREVFEPVDTDYTDEFLEEAESLHAEGTFRDLANVW